MRTNVTLKLWKSNGDLASKTHRMYPTILAAAEAGYASRYDFSICEKPDQKLKLYWSGRQADKDKPTFANWRTEAILLDQRHGFR